jgi:predicted transcriptional regulator YdeE
MELTIISSVRTNNFNDDRLVEKIAGLWKEASSHLNQNQIIYGVYHNYESDYKGNYTLSIAIEDSQGHPSLKIPKNGNYEIVHVDTTDEQGVVHTWKKIWESEDSRTLTRAYTYDFEKYYPNGDIEIYIAIEH